ncbi:tgs1 protein [Moniliophthora roreri MCA 2997]|uniref:Trimethylguanosine synthase n=2 Tax=Moniliophthora roreri TaxID=221103 RepID=V2XES4_MONRO|nr:tgs1 protein [Moniliophthora roreri MCA 2997]KAI3598094.1 tgs1 protein [Moniliophthora roreri]
MGKRKAKPAFSGLGSFVQALQVEGDSSTRKEPNTSAATNVHDRPAKRRKTISEPQYVEKYDMTGRVPHYQEEWEVPEPLKKYFFQRTRYFSLYSTPPGCLLDEEGWYSVTPERIANQIAERCRCHTVLDAFCGVGGNAIAFAKTCQRVIALDTSPTRLALARHNAQIYGVAHHIEFILSDYITFAKSYLARSSTLTSPKARKIDVVFLSPPWGGPSYLSDSNTPSGEEEDLDAHPTYPLSAIEPIHGAELFHLSRRITPNIAYYLPRNSDLNEISAVLGEGEEYVEVEEEWMGNKLKALTCYFGGLAEGQEDLF